MGFPFHTPLFIHPNTYCVLTAYGALERTAMQMTAAIVLPLWSLQPTGQ